MASKGPGKSNPAPKRATVTPPDDAKPATASHAADLVAHVATPGAVTAESPAETSHPALETAQNVTETAMTETSNFTSTAHAAAEKASAAFADLSQHGRNAFEKGSRVAEDITDLTKGNVEALVASSRAAAKGAEVLFQSAAEYGRRSFEHGSNALKTLTSAKTPTEFFQLHNEFAKAHFDQLVAETSKFSETFVKLAGDVVQPLSTRVSVAADKLKSAATL